jgi:propanol-preferring alcohol dehydrogenase
MRAMVLSAQGSPLLMTDRADPVPDDGEIRVTVSACGVCRTDLHLIDAELPNIQYPIIPGHEIVGRVDLIGRGVTGHQIGDSVGIPWLGYTCGACRYCRLGMENLCDRPLFTGYTRDMAGDAERLGIYGFGAAGHIVAQIAAWQRRAVFAFTRAGETRRKSLLGNLARSGPVHRTSNHRLHWMPPSSTPQRVNWCRWPCAPFERVAE